MVRPVHRRTGSPEEIERRFAESTLTTLDIPSHLDWKLATEVETGTALYLLVQLFGTPNVPGVEAGADQRDREKTTWQYLFAVTYEPPNDDRAEPRGEGGCSDRIPTVGVRLQERSLGRPLRVGRYRTRRSLRSSRRWRP
ncbi:hypothetical protein [Haladaptatus halobius]|uniref:hypothetical protein n=1 Tax=Haladaptatus halobius TaxID=2884875 RepID=UPI001D0B4499|nr:hypothetical protein [Haladaptatus halobius]